MADLKIALQLTAADLLSPQIQSAIRGIEQLQARVNMMNGAAANTPPVTTPSVVGKHAQEAAEHVSRLGGLLGHLTSTAGGVVLGNLVTGPILGLVESLTSLPGTLLDANSQIERATVSFTAFTHSGSLANEMLKALRENEKHVPFTFSDVLAIGQASIPYAGGTTAGLMKIVKQAELLASIRPDEGLQGARFAQDEAISGIFVSLERRFGVSRKLINDLKSEGYDGLNLIDEALRRMGADWGLVEAQSKTFAGQMTTLASIAQQFEQRLGASFFESVRGGLSTLTSAANDNQVALNGMADSFGKAFGSATAATIAGAERDLIGIYNLLNNARMEADTILQRHGGVSRKEDAGGPVFGIPGAPSREDVMKIMNYDPLQAFYDMEEKNARALRFAEGAAQRSTDMFDPTHIPLHFQTDSAGVPQRAAAPPASGPATGGLPWAAAWFRNVGEKGAEEAARAYDQALAKTSDTMSAAAGGHPMTQLWDTVALRIDVATERLNNYQRQFSAIGADRGIVAGEVSAMVEARRFLRRHHGSQDQIASLTNSIKGGKAEDIRLLLEGGDAAQKAWLARGQREVMISQRDAQVMTLDEQRTSNDLLRQMVAQAGTGSANGRFHASRGTIDGTRATGERP